jgi:hypothetical protein
MALGSTQPLTEISTTSLPGGKRRPAPKADNLTTLSEPAGSNYDSLRLYVTGNNDAILDDVARNTAVSLVGVHHIPEGASGRSFGTPPRGPAGQRQSHVLDQYDQPGLVAKFP